MIGVDPVLEKEGVAQGLATRKGDPGMSLLLHRFFGMTKLLSRNTQRIDELNHVCTLFLAFSRFHGVSNVTVLFWLSSCTYLVISHFDRLASIEICVSISNFSMDSLASTPNRVLHNRVDLKTLLKNRMSSSSRFFE